MKHTWKRLLYMLIMVLCVMSVFTGIAVADEGNAVMLLEVKGEVNAAMTTYIQDAISEAELAGRPIVLVVDTYGGQILEADNIKKAILEASVPVDCYITRNALSAGVLISISCDNIVMADSAVIGAAETIPNDEKTLSTWVGILKSAAEARGRDTQVVAALADKRISIDGVTEEGSLLTLGATKAEELGISDGTAQTKKDALVLLGYDGYDVTEQGMDFSVRAAQILTSTTVASILFLVALVCMGIEIFTAGFGVFGIVSIICFILYLGGGLLAGFAEWWSMALFFAGLILLGIEIVVPGFGVFGVLGFFSLGAGILFSSRDVTTFLTVLCIGVVGSIVLLPILYKVFKKMGLLRKLALGDGMLVKDGYVSHEHIESLVGKKGLAVTVLRPAGVVKIDGVRYSVISSGAYIASGSDIIVIEHTPGRIVVEDES